MYDAAFEKAYQQLNEQQREAVDTIEGPVIVLAGPGTGKTQILALRIANILRQTQMNPQNILALTFTESGVKAMRERLIQFIGHSAYYVQIHTFHSFCNRVIQENPQAFQSQRELTMLTELDRVQLLQKVISEVELEQLTSLNNQFYYLQAVSRTISDLKRENVDPQKFTQILLAEHEALQAKLAAGELKESALAYKQALKNLQKNKDLLRIYKRFNELMAKFGYYDYDDMILFVLKAWQDNPLLLSKYQERFQYILADEYQDTNTAQNAVLFALASYFENPNLFTVGDDDQAIYRFQGASVENLFVYLNKYPQAKKINLKTNYRSTQLILDAAHSLIVNNQMRVKEADHQLEAHHGPAEKPLDFWQFLQGEQENAYLVKQIQELETAGVPLREVAVICRDNRDLAEIQEVLEKTDIAVFNHAAKDLLATDFIRTIIDYWRLIIKPTEDTLLARIANQPWSAISKLAFYKLAKAHKRSVHYLDLIVKGEVSDLSESEQAELNSFLNQILDLQRNSQQVCLDRFVKEFWSMVGLDKWTATQVNHLELLRQYTSLVNLVMSFASRNPELTLAQLVEKLDLMQEYRIKVPEQNWSPQSDLVQLMTAHRSKGLEFDYVFLPKLYDGKWGNKSVPSLITLPDSILEIAANQTKEPNEDERRLFYVALTRARKHIYLSQAEQYHYQGTERETIPAMFTEEIATEFVSKHGTDETKLGEEELVSLLEDKLVPAKPAHSKIEQDYLQSLLADFRLSPTSLGTWQRCPRQFFYKYVLKIPHEYTPNLELGIAVHNALEKYFLDYKIGKNVNVPDLVAYFDEALARRHLDKLDRERITAEGQKMLSSWLEAKAERVHKPLFLEYDFGSHNVNLEGIPLTGKVDKIELIDQATNSVRIIDYKTGSVKSKNAIMGQTKSDDGQVYQQLVFYKLLSELDPMFPYNVREVLVDFIKPRSSGKHAEFAFEISESDVNSLKSEIKKAYKEIQELAYPLPDLPCQCRGECEWRF